LAKVVVRAMHPVMMSLIMKTTLLLMVQGATLAMDLAIISVLVIVCEVSLEKDKRLPTSFCTF
jgi:hypothetical protein